jgi:hypothetical protein
VRPTGTVLVCGSRDWPAPERILHRLAQLAPGTRIIHGAARGADQQAATIARGLSLEERAYPADWRGQGRRAGVLRNLAMLDTQPDLVIAFQRNGSRGTQHTIDEARRRGIPVEVHIA